MTFTVTPLINGGTLVEGTDSKGKDGSTILHSERWNMVVHLRTHKVAQEQYDDVVRAFFAPLTDAADQAKALLAGPTQDWGTVTISDGVEGHESEVIELDNDGILLRLLDEGQSDLLRWVGNDLVAIQQ